MAYTFRTKGFAGGVGQTTTVVTLDAVTAIGDLIVVGVGCGLIEAPQTINTPTDNKSNSYSATGAVLTNGNARVQQFFTIDAAGGVSQVTVTFGASVTAGVTVHVYSGAYIPPAFRGRSTGTGNSSSLSVSSLSTNAGNLVVATAAIAYAPNGWTVGANYSFRNVPSSADRMSQEDRLSVTTAETAPFTTTGSGNWAEIAVEYAISTQNPVGQQLNTNVYIIR